MFKVALLLALTSVALARRVQFTDCGAGEINFVDIDPCASEPCMFKKGAPVKLQAQIKANQNTASGNLEVTVNIGGSEVEYPGIETDICKLVTCPIKKGQVYTINYELTPEDYFPNLVTEMKWKATGENGVLLCASSTVGIEE